MSVQRHPQVRWILWQQTTTGFVARCDVCGAATSAGTPQAVDGFAAQHQAHPSPAPGHLGLGDVVAAGTKALGIEPCSPCEARRRALNERFPRFWPRSR